MAKVPDFEDKPTDETSTLLPSSPIIITPSSETLVDVQDNSIQNNVSLGGKDQGNIDNLEPVIEEDGFWCNAYAKLLDNLISVQWWMAAFYATFTYHLCIIGLLSGTDWTFANTSLVFMILAAKEVVKIKAIKLGAKIGAKGDLKIAFHKIISDLESRGIWIIVLMTILSSKLLEYKLITGRQWIIVVTGTIALGIGARQYLKIANFTGKVPFFM